MEVGMAEVLDQLVEIVDDPQEQVIWLNARNDQLGGMKPIELVNRGKGDKVLDLIEAMKGGAFL